MKKKILVLLGALVLSLGLFGCGDDSSDSESYSDDSTYSDYDYGSDYDDEADLGDYDYNGDGDISTDEFQDATEDYMDQNGW